MRPKNYSPIICTKDILFKGEQPDCRWSGFGEARLKDAFVDEVNVFYDQRVSAMEGLTDGQNLASFKGLSYQIEEPTQCTRKNKSLKKL